MSLAVAHIDMQRHIFPSPSWLFTTIRDMHWTSRHCALFALTMHLQTNTCEVQQRVRRTRDASTTR